MYANLQDIRAPDGLSASPALTTKISGLGAFSFPFYFSIPVALAGASEHLAIQQASFYFRTPGCGVAVFTTTVLVFLSVSFFVSRISYTIHKHREAREGIRLFRG